MRNFGKSKTKSHIDNFRRHGALSSCFFVIVLGIAALGYFSNFSASMATLLNDSFKDSCISIRHSSDIPYCIPTCNSGYLLSKNMCTGPVNTETNIIYQQFPTGVEWVAEADRPQSEVYYDSHDSKCHYNTKGTPECNCNNIKIVEGSLLIPTCAAGFFISYDSSNSPSCTQCPDYPMQPGPLENLQTYQCGAGDNSCIQGQSDTNNRSGKESCYIIPTDKAKFTDETGSGVFVVADDASNPLGNRCSYEEITKNLKTGRTMIPSNPSQVTPSPGVGGGSSVSY